METLNGQVFVTGYLGKTPNITYSDKGFKIATFSVQETTEGYVKINGKVQDRTTCYTALARGQNADFLENYGRKGANIKIHGKKIVQSYVAKNGQHKQRELIEVDWIQGS